jgi:hypothetical protein
MIKVNEAPRTDRQEHKRISPAETERQAKEKAYPRRHALILDGAGPLEAVAWGNELGVFSSGFSFWLHACSPR